MSLSSHFKGTYGTMYYVRDMTKAVSLYKNVFGFKVGFESKEWTEIEHNGANLCLHGADAKMKDLPGGILIYQVEKLGELYKQLKAKGVEFMGEPHRVNGDDYSVTFKDPDGNMLSLHGKMT